MADDIIIRCRKLQEYLYATVESMKIMYNRCDAGKKSDLGDKMLLAISKLGDYLAIVDRPEMSAAFIVNEIAAMAKQIVRHANSTSSMCKVSREAMRFLMAVVFEIDITLGRDLLIDRKKMSQFFERVDSSKPAGYHLLAVSKHLQKFVAIASTDLAEPPVAM